ncbi:hypothetical protein DFH06DRAFT_968282 [Mycena polygramma]|nr:hypothetical protein DFH06DRAFT_968282 [Mycena polygramma]
MELDVPSTPLERIEELWFEDGNLVIQAGNSQYRVYRGVLATRSPIFRDLLGLPQPADADLVDGCPFVQLPDPDVEVTPFFKAIFEPEFFMPYPARTEFDAIVGCLSLSHKYGVDYLFRRALVHFSSRYPTTLSHMDAYTFDKQTVPSWSCPDEPTFRIRAMQLARQVDATWILPVAFYRLSPCFEDLASAIFHGASYRGINTNLSSRDQASFAIGHNMLSRDTAVDSLRFLTRPLVIEGCLDPFGCHFHRLRAIEGCRDCVRDQPYNFLNMWVPDDWDSGFLEVCAICRTELKKTHEDARVDFWDKLPEMYGLPAWPELEEMKAAAIGTNPFG